MKNKKEAKEEGKDDQQIIQRGNSLACDVGGQDGCSRIFIIFVFLETRRGSCNGSLLSRKKIALCLHKSKTKRNQEENEGSVRLRKRVHV